MENKNIKWKQKFFTIGIGQSISLIGSSAVQFAVMWWLAIETSSPMMLGFAGLAAFLPTAILSPFAGVWIDRLKRKNVVICADLFMGIAAAIFAMVLWTYEPPYWTALVVLFIRGIGNTFHTPAIQSLIPMFVPAEHLVKVNGWSQFMQSGAFLLGPVIGAAMFAALPLPLILLTDTLGAVIASSTMAMVHVEEPPKSNAQTPHFLSEMKEGLMVYAENKTLLILAIAETVAMIFYLPLSSFYPLMTSSYFNGTAWHGSAVELMFAAGMLIASFLFGSVITIKRKIKTSYLGLLGVGIISLLCGILPPHMWAWYIFAVLCGILGACGTVHSIPFMSYMQENIAPEKMGRAFSMLGSINCIVMPLGLLIASPMAEKFGVNIWFVITGIAVIIVTLVCSAISPHKK